MILKQEIMCSDELSHFFSFDLHIGFDFDPFSEIIGGHKQIPRLPKARLSKVPTMQMATCL